MRPPASAEWLWYCVRLWSTSDDQSDSARGVSTPAIAGQASSAQAILRGQVLGTLAKDATHRGYRLTVASHSDRCTPTSLSVISVVTPEQGSPDEVCFGLLGIGAVGA